MKIVFLDCQFINPGDLSWKPLEELGELVTYKGSTPEQAKERIKGADVVIADKFVMTREIIQSADTLKIIAEAATGFNNIDLEAAKDNGIAVSNVPAYSTDAVAQHAFALILALTNKVRELDEMVSAGDWLPARKSVYDALPVTLLTGKSLGIVGYGNIGRKLAQIGEAFGMKINIYSRDKEAAIKSDIVSLHCPLSEDTKNLVDARFISQMKDGALLINTSRGALVDEKALYDAIVSKKLGGAGLDVIKTEPTDKDPDYHFPNVLITPHVAFAPKETRDKIIRICSENIRGFFEGNEVNRIV